MKRKLLLLIPILLIILLLSGCNSNKEKIESVDSNSNKVKRAMSYISFHPDLNENLVEKLFDKNTSIIKVEDLTKEEKMFLTLERYSSLNSGNIYYTDKVQFSEEDLENLVFEDNAFIKDFKEEKKEFIIEDNINLSYDNGLFTATGKPGNDFTSRVLYPDIIKAEKKDNQLIIDFRVAYLTFDQLEEKIDKEIVYYYNELKADKPILEKEIKPSPDYNFGPLDENYTKYRYTLKLERRNVYFESIEKIEG